MAPFESTELVYVLVYSVNNKIDNESCLHLSTAHFPSLTELNLSKLTVTKRKTPSRRKDADIWPGRSGPTL